MTSEDIAECIYWAATLPPHLNINTMVRPACLPHHYLQTVRVGAQQGRLSRRTDR